MTQESAPNIVAVIVTYNRKALLEKCLLAVADQTQPTHSVIVVDNASTDGTGQWLSNWMPRHLPNSHKLTLPENTGGAGGFHEGIKAAYASGADWVWLMDDDCIPEPDCLERLLAGRERLSAHGVEDVGFLASRVLWKDGSPCRMNLPVIHHEWIESHRIHYDLSRIVASSFVSMLVHRDAIAQVGLPVKEFFIWFDDSEYSHRISATRRCYLVSSSVVTHCTEKNVAALDFNELKGSTLWKFRYGVRNEASYVFHSEGGFAWLLFTVKIMTRSRRAGVSIGQRLHLILASFRGLWFPYERYLSNRDDI